MKRKTIIPILVLVILLAAAALLFGDELFDRSEKVPYTLFIEKLEAAEISEATIAPEKITFRLKNDETRYAAENPGSPDLKERLLLSGAAVTDAGSAESTMTFIGDMFFNVFFIGLIGFGIWKLVSWSRNTFRVVHHTGVHFDDVAGMDGLKRDMMILVDVLKNPQKYKDKGLRPIKGIIFEGEPGNGKTFFARALAEECGVNFIAAKGADFQSALMSMGANKIKMLFRKAARNKPCIIFIDEFDSIGERRNYAGSGIDKENNRIITTMLNEMDGFRSGEGVLVIAATNSYQSLDPALIRPGRFDLKYNIGNPDAATRKQLIGIYTRGKALDAELNEEMLCAVFEGLSCAAIETILNESAAIAQMQNNGVITAAIIHEAAARTDCRLAVKSTPKKK